ncbi:SIR2 family protein [Mycetocola saprophilus]|uniref:SIR2 family protein n=1 Tax=Mycetocola saprophilus TaxID=76636 RepID=UPI003BF1ACD5
MSAPDVDESMIDALRKSGTLNHCTFLLGAGASVSSGLPDWDTFAVRLLANSGALTAEVTARQLLSKQDPMLVVEAARTKSGEKWDTNLKAALYWGNPNLDPSPLHLAVAAHILSTKDVNASVSTLNFDDVLERTLNSEVPSIARSVFDGDKTEAKIDVMHLHGLITPERTENVILTLTDFTEIIAKADSWQSSYISEALQNGALLIAGTSYRDPDLRQWLRLALSSKPEGHSVIVILARQGFQLSREDFEALQGTLSEQWKAIGVEPLLVQDHTDAAQLINEIRFIHEPGYLSPQQRAATIWQTHKENFEEWQTEYVSKLRENASELKQTLSVTNLSLTLWLSNGKSQLARWAAHDRHYLSADTLRLVSTGHDSHWIAGQALGNDTLLLKELEQNSSGRWTSVLAIPIPVGHPRFSTVSVAVLTIGLPKTTAEIEDSRMLWGNYLSTAADDWGTLLSRNAFGQ